MSKSCFTTLRFLWYRYLESEFRIVRSTELWELVHHCGCICKCEIDGSIDNEC